ncbi:helix-turn-helix domain-containing protein [Candidatus Poribacteria bacterium]
MATLLDWVIQNKEWLFSGAVFAIVSLIIAIASRKKETQHKTTPLSIQLSPCFSTNTFVIFYRGEYMTDWISVKEAAKIKGCTPANINYYIKQGKVEARKVKGRWEINPESLNLKQDYNKEFDILEVLKAQLKEKDKQIATLQEQVTQAQQLVAMEKMEKQKLLEDKTTPWYKKWFRKREENNDI